MQNRIPDGIQVFVKVDTGYRIGYKNFQKSGYRIGYKILSKWIPDTGLDTNFVSFCGYCIRSPDTYIRTSLALK